MGNGANEGGGVVGAGGVNVMTKVSLLSHEKMPESGSVLTGRRRRSECGRVWEDAVLCGRCRVASDLV
ncbi:hypothetical protein E2C01_052544 [Portunus trituberculatus]|uniref:Uncharacterized protein n=1 Tax=Portunus trituberculatus TaxID=210409 RepID=A0A5B7GNB3_PORTR|nr:hypothetical protein [Portunus trituberculatus]